MSIYILIFIRTLTLHADRSPHYKENLKGKSKTLCLLLTHVIIYRKWSLVQGWSLYSGPQQQTTTATCVKLLIIIIAVPKSDPNHCLYQVSTHDKSANILYGWNNEPTMNACLYVGLTVHKNHVQSQALIITCFCLCWRNDHLRQSMSRLSLVPCINQ